MMKKKSSAQTISHKVHYMFIHVYFQCEIYLVCMICLGGFLLYRDNHTVFYSIMINICISLRVYYIKAMRKDGHISVIISHC